MLRRGGISPVGITVSSPAFRIREFLPSFQVQPPNPPDLKFMMNFRNQLNFGGFSPRCFSSDTAPVEVNGPEYSALVGIFSGRNNLDNVEGELDSAGLKIDHGVLISVLGNLDESPDVACRIFNWFADKKPEIISSATYNTMLGILGFVGKTTEFWEMLDVMKKKGYCLSKNAFLKASKGLEEKGMAEDLGLLKEIYASNSPENYVSRMASRVGKILREGDELGIEVWKVLKSLEAEFSGDLVAAVLNKLSSYPAKGFLFFRWVIDDMNFKPEHKSYNAMARVLGREDCIEDFWVVLKEMRENGGDLDAETYSVVSKRFLSRRMMKEAVDLYEFSMAGEEKPSPSDFLHLLRKIVSCNKLELPLVSRIFKKFKDEGYPLKDSIFKSLLKSLTSVGKLGDCQNLLKAMEEGGFSGNVNDHVAVGLCRSRKPDEALSFMIEKESLGFKFDPKTWGFVIQSYSLAGSTEKSLACFNAMIKGNDREKVGHAFDALMMAYLRKNKVLDALGILSTMVEKNQLQPWQTTYKLLIKKLLSEGKLKEASGLLQLMKRHGYPPFIEPFFGYISKFGNGEDAMLFLKSITVRPFPSISVFLRTMEAFLKAGRKEVADDLLSRTPGYVRNHADVLNLIFSLKSSSENPNPGLVPV